MIILIIFSYFSSKKNNKNHQLVENIIAKNLTIKERRNDVVGDIFIYNFSLKTMYGDFVFHRCHLILLDDALVILGWHKTKLFTKKAKPIIVTFQEEKYEKLFPMAYITGYKKANYYTNSNSVYFEIGNSKKSSHFSADMHLYRLDKEFREEIIKSLEKNDLAG